MRLPVLSSYPGSMIVCPSCRSPDGSCALAAGTPAIIVTVATKRPNHGFDGIVDSLLRVVCPAWLRQRDRQSRGETGAAVQSSDEVRQSNVSERPFLFRLFRAVSEQTSHRLNDAYALATD